MRVSLSTLFFILSLQVLSAQSVLEQKATLNVQDAPLGDILDALILQCGVKFAYDKRRIPLRKKVSIQANKLPLEDLLTTLLAGTNIQFSARRKQISLYRKIIPYHTISGYIRDSISGEMLIEANVYEAKYFLGTSSNEYGFYSLTLPEGSHLIKTSYVGYQEIADSIDLYEDIQFDIPLLSGNELAEVIVVGNPNALVEATAVLQKSRDSGERINIERAQSLPTFMGERDVLKYVQLLPGVVSGGLGGSNLFIRGGNADQNLILLDDVPLYNVNHLFGVVSTINGDITHSAKTYLDGFPARHGGRLSSLIDIRTKEGNKQQYHGGATMGWMIGKAYIEGPIQKGKSSFIVASRRSWLNYILAGNVDPTFSFYDVNAKGNFQLSKKDRLFVSYYTGKDVNLIEGDEVDQVGTTKLGLNVNWRNTALSMRWNRIIGKRIFANTTLLQSTFDYNIAFEREQATEEKNAAYFQYNSFIKEYGLKTAIDYLPSAKHHIRLGGSHRLLRNNTGRLSRQTIYQGDSIRTSTGVPALNVSHHTTMYLEDEIQLKPSLTVHPGIRLEAFQVPDKTWWIPQLRLRLHYSKNDQEDWSFSFSEMTQFIHLLTSSSLEAGGSKWVSATKNTAPARSRQLSMSYQSFFKPKWKAKIGAYYKKMSDLQRFELNANIINSITDWEDHIVTGTGTAYGMEFLLAKTKGATQGWITYTYSKSRRQFESFQEDLSFLHYQDRPHNFNATLTHQFKEKNQKERQFSLVWTFVSGHWLTLPEQAFSSQQGVILSNSTVVNNYRLSPFHRLDFAYSKKRTTKRGFEHNWQFGIYNVYGQKNPHDAVVIFNEQRQEFELVSNSLSVTPIPYMTYGFRF